MAKFISIVYHTRELQYANIAAVNQSVFRVMDLESANINAYGIHVENATGILDADIIA